MSSSDKSGKLSFEIKVNVDSKFLEDLNKIQEKPSVTNIYSSPFSHHGLPRSTEEIASFLPGWNPYQVPVGIPIPPPSFFQPVPIRSTREVPSSGVLTEQKLREIILDIINSKESQKKSSFFQDIFPSMLTALQILTDEKTGPSVISSLNNLAKLSSPATSTPVADISSIPIGSVSSGAIPGSFLSTIGSLFSPPVSTSFTSTSSVDSSSTSIPTGSVDSSTSIPTGSVDSSTSIPTGSVDSSSSSTPAGSSSSTVSSSEKLPVQSAKDQIMGLMQDALLAKIAEGFGSVFSESEEKSSNTRSIPVLSRASYEAMMAKLAEKNKNNIPPSNSEEKSNSTPSSEKEKKSNKSEEKSSVNSSSTPSAKPSDVPSTSS